MVEGYTIFPYTVNLIPLLIFKKYQIPKIKICQNYTSEIGIKGIQ